jgi:hypothetical protein
MRRESSTVVVLVGEIGDGLLAGLARSPGVSVARAAGNADPARDDAGGAAARPGWESGARALREAARHRSMYVIVPDDPLADMAAAWRAMWEAPAGPGGAAAFEEHAAQALAAWRDRRFELPDYYLVVPPAQGTTAGPDLYLGPLRAVRPRRVALAATADGAAQVAGVRRALGALGHGPWWPPLDELVDAARHFYAGGLAETQQVLRA